jgi:hypothetical protein
MHFRILATSTFALAILTSLNLPTSAAGDETAITPEISPPGDIPDNQVFVVFRSPAGFSIRVPEGWARKDGADTTVFTDKYNEISLTIGSAPSTVTVALGRSTLAPEIEKSGRAVKINNVSEIALLKYHVLRIVYDSNSEPNAVTNKQIREENERFYFAKDGKLVILQLSAPKGADNADQWRLISSSFRWN